MLQRRVPRRPRNAHLGTIRVMLTALLAAVALAAIVGADSVRSATKAQVCDYRLRGGLPDPDCTPGLRNPDVTPRRINKTICVVGWTKTIRPPSSVTYPMKRESMREYGAKGEPSDYEYDHLISLQLGGHPSDPRNLWPEPYNVRGDNNDLAARNKDVVETRLKKLVCNGLMRVRTAQRIIARDWRQGRP
jgi:hypothetical protein